MHPSRRFCVRLTRLRIGVERFRSSLNNWGIATTAAVECGAENQTVDHTTTYFRLYCPSNGTNGLIR